MDVNQSRETVEMMVFEAQMKLLDPGISKRFLQECRDILTPVKYVEVVEERSTAGLCGYPLCINRIESQNSIQEKGKYRISVTEQRVYDSRPRLRYCSDDCAVDSGTFQGSLSEDVLLQKKRVPTTNLENKISRMKLDTNTNTANACNTKADSKPPPVVTAQVFEKLNPPPPCEVFPSTDVTLDIDGYCPTMLSIHETELMDGIKARGGGNNEMFCGNDMSSGDEMELQLPVLGSSLAQTWHCLSEVVGPLTLSFISKLEEWKPGTDDFVCDRDYSESSLSGRVLQKLPFICSHLNMTETSTATSFCKSLLSTLRQCGCFTNETILTDSQITLFALLFLYVGSERVPNFARSTRFPDDIQSALGRLGLGAAEFGACARLVLDG